jgi:hypothetical protein
MISATLAMTTKKIVAFDVLSNELKIDCSLLGHRRSRMIFVMVGLALLKADTEYERL